MSFSCPKHAPRGALLFSALALAFAAHSSFAEGPLAAPVAPPSQLYAELFVAVQSGQIFEDQKTFVDATPNGDPAQILAQYRQQKDQPGFDLKQFVQANFSQPQQEGITPPTGQTLRDHINWLWPKLTRNTPTAPANSSLLPLPKPYVVPGGRFREGYYWDTWFTMLGLQEAGHEDLVDDMLDNFAYEIDAYGHIPNGNRNYYLSRSQPPFFALMVQLAAEKEGKAIYARYLPQLQKEYAYWMRGSLDTAPGQAMRNVVVLPDHTVLNRYWDELDTPRDESWLQDVTTAKTVQGRAAPEVYRDLRAAAESGWDFSSRWFGDSQNLATIRTTAILPVDLNSLMYQLEKTIATGCKVTHDARCVSEFNANAARRAVAINKYLWNGKGYYGDYDWQLGQPRDNVSAAMAYPLFVGVATSGRARSTVKTLESQLLQAGGLNSTTLPTRQQWDSPNGWAPLQWIAIEGARRYHQTAFAEQVATRFLANVQAVYDKQQKLVEKYDVSNNTGGGGGEYPLQDGFGWSNGVTLKLLDMTSKH